MTDFTTLQQSLINAKKVMNKVDGGDFSSGKVNTSSINAGNITDSTGLLSQTPSPQLPNVDMKGARKDLNPKAAITEEKIKKSKLPESIKQAMINNPIPDIPFGNNVGLSGDFISGVKEQMEKQNIPTSPTSLTENIVPTPSRTKPQTAKLTATTLKKIIKETVKELLDEVVDSKINESVNMKSSENENFQFKVGNRIFYGKITSSKALK